MAFLAFSKFKSKVKWAYESLKSDQQKKQLNIVQNYNKTYESKNLFYRNSLLTSLLCDLLLYEWESVSKMFDKHDFGALPVWQIHIYKILHFQIWII